MPRKPRFFALTPGKSANRKLRIPGRPDLFSAIHLGVEIPLAGRRAFDLKKVANDSPGSHSEAKYRGYTCPVTALCVRVDSGT